MGKKAQKEEKRVKRNVTLSKESSDYVDETVDGIKYYNIGHFFDVIIKEHREKKQ